MKDLRILSEITTRYGNRNINELEFKTPEEFADYKKKHKMRPGTVVKVAGKDKVVGGDDASKASPKKRFSDIPFTQADVGQIKQFAKDNNLDIKDMSRDPNGAISVDFDGSPEDMEKALTSDAYGDDPQDAKDTVARGTEIGKDSESKPKETTPIENRPGETFGKNYKSVGDMMDSISQQKERVQLNIFDFDSMDQFNGALFIEDGKLMYPGLDGEPTEVNDQDTQMALFDLVKDEQVNVGRSEFRQGDRIKDNGGMHSANILKNIKGNWDFDGVQKIGNDFYNADGEKMDNDDIEDFYYEQGYDEDDNNVGIELGRPLPSDAKPPTRENLNHLSKITTRYTNRLDERTKIRGANNKMVEVPKSYVDKTGKFAYRFYKTSGMGGDLTSDVKLGYQRYHKIPPNDEFSGSVILKKDAMDVKKKDINLVMKNLKSVAKQNGINLYIMKYVPDRNDPFIEFKMRMK